MTEEKPLFIPLKTEYYNQFLSGEKTYEIRKYGARWNIHTCRVGRKATLSKGYGKQNRISGVITGFEFKSIDGLPPEARDAARKIYGDNDCFFVIWIHIERA